MINNEEFRGEIDTISYLNFISSISLKKSAALYGQEDLVRLIRRILLKGIILWYGPLLTSSESSVME